MVNTRFRFCLEIHKSVYPIEKYLHNTIELHRDSLQLINWHVEKGGHVMEASTSFYRVCATVSVSCDTAHDARTAWTGLNFVLSRDPNIAIIDKECISKDLFSD